MRYSIFNLSTIVSFLAVTACSLDARQMPSQATTTYSPKKPVITEGESYRLARGATRVENMDVVYDSETRSMSVKGQIEFMNFKTSTLDHINIDMVGIADENGFIVLKGTPGMVIADRGLQVAAKATCLGDGLNCTSSFIDFYIYTNGVVYHHQVENEQDQKGTIDGETDADDSDAEYYTGGADGVEGDPGPYVGSVREDIRSLLDWNLIPDAQTGEAKGSETPKKDKENKSDAKDGQEKGKDKQEPVKEAPAPSAPQTPAPGGNPQDGKPGNGSKKDEPKKEEPKREDPKATPPAKGPPKKETPAKGGTTEETKPATPPAQDKGAGTQPIGKADGVDGIPKANQAIGAVNAGRLEAPADLVTIEKQKSNPGFKVIRPERNAHFGANELAYIIQYMGQVTEQILPGHTLFIGDLSRARGGKLGSHLSHQNGLDVDATFYFKNKEFPGRFPVAVTNGKVHSDWLAEQQWHLFKAVVNTKLIDRIFIHQALKKSLCELAIKNGELQKGKNDSLAFETLRRLVHEPGHHNHFHLRVKCSSAQVRCRQMAEPVANSGCF